MSIVIKNEKRNSNLVYVDDLEIRIEKARQKLHSMFQQYDDKGLNGEMLEMSQYLDKLIVTYIKKYQS